MTISINIEYNHTNDFNISINSKQNQHNISII